MQSETSSLTQAQDDQVRLILADVKEGLDSFCRAGERLIRLKAEVPGIYQIVAERCPMLNEEALNTLEMFGRRRWHPIILMYTPQEQKSLKALSYEEHERLLVRKELVHVMVQGENGTYETDYVAYADMTTWQRLNHVREGKVQTVAEVKARLLAEPKPPRSDVTALYRLDEEDNIVWNTEVKWTLELAIATLAEIERKLKGRKSKRKYARNKT
jgi:hypothetical protein